MIASECLGCIGLPHRGPRQDRRIEDPLSMNVATRRPAHRTPPIEAIPAAVPTPPSNRSAEPHAAPGELRARPMLTPTAAPCAALDEFAGDPNFMASLARGLLVIRVLQPQTPQMTISQLSIKTGLSRAAVRRCLYTLIKLGFAGVEDGSRYSLRPQACSRSPTPTPHPTRSPPRPSPSWSACPPPARELLRRHARRRRHRLHRTLQRLARHVRRSAHRLAACLPTAPAWAAFCSPTCPPTSSSSTSPAWC